ncbi:hypothetical protein ABZ760_25800, partial [Streptomyces sp. NPDC006658]
MTEPRPARPDDAFEIARLRSELVLTEPLDASWLAVCRDQLTARLQPGGDARAYVIDATDGGLARCAGSGGGGPLGHGRRADRGGRTRLPR